MEGSPEKVVEPKVEDGESNKSAAVEDLPNPSQNDNVVPDDAEIIEGEGLPGDKVTPDTSIIPEKQPDEKIDDDNNAQPMEFATPVVKSEAATNGFNDMEMVDSYDSGTEDECAAFMKELEKFYKDNALDYKPPKFYGEPLNCLKLWRSVIRLGGYDRVTGSKLWRQVGESFHPPKTCTTVSWTFRIFYEKALLEYEKHKRQTGELQFSESALSEQAGAINESSGYKTPGPGRQRRDAAARAMQGWHSQRHHGYDEEKNSHSSTKREKHLKSIGVSKQKKPTVMENAEKALRFEGDKQIAISVIDLGSPADWVKINVRETKDCFEVYALVPGLLREEVRVQSDPAGRLVITGQPEQLDNPWGITPFKKVVNLPARIDPLQTSAVVSLHGRLFVRVPFEQSNYAR